MNINLTVNTGLANSLGRKEGIYVSLLTSLLRKNSKATIKNTFITFVSMKSFLEA